MNTILKTALSKPLEIKTLSLKSQKLKTVPKEIVNLENLEELDLSDNKLDKVPEFIGELKKLKKLNIDNTDQNEIGDYIGELVDLEYLSFKSNFITKISPSIQNLKKLKSILCYSAQPFFSGLGAKNEEIISKIKSLEVIQFNHPKTTHWPQFLNPNLKELLYNGTFTSIEKNISLLKDLESLTLNAKGLNDIKSFEHLISLKKLKKISLEFCKDLDTFPTPISKIKSLEEINICNTSIEELPDELIALEKLKQITAEEEIKFSNKVKKHFEKNKITVKGPWD